MKTVLAIIGLILGAVAIAVFFFTAQTYIKQQAIDGCLQAGRITLTDKNTVVPENYWYTLCMKEKGYKTTGLK